MFRFIGIVLLLLCDASTGIAFAQCAPSNPLLPGAIPVGPAFAAAWKPAFGAPVGPPRFTLSDPSVYQEYRCGVIAAYPQWPFLEPGSASGPGIFSTLHDTPSGLTVAWNGPIKFDTFLVESGEDGVKFHKGAPNHTALDSGGVGKHFVSVKRTQTVGVRIRGCTKAPKDCGVGDYTTPVWMDIDPFVLPPPFVPGVPAFDPHPSLAPGELSLIEPYDGDGLAPHQRKALRDYVCRSSRDVLSTGEKDKGELDATPTLALLEFVRDEPASQPGCTFQSASEIREFVNKEIMKAKVSTQIGTDMGALTRYLVPLLLPVFLSILAASVLAPLLGLLNAATGSLVAFVVSLIIVLFNLDKPGDYDMKLQGILQIAYRFEGQLDVPTRCHILEELLPANGGVGELNEFLWINVLPTPIRETENHVLMIQSARYLSNNLYQKWSGACPGSSKWEAWKDKNTDNDANGMTDWWLRELQRLMIEDYYEFNARPYAEHGQQPIRNLFEFAAVSVASICKHAKDTPLAGAAKRMCDVRRSARNVLDYNAARFATSSNNFRRAVPFRRHMDERGYTRLLGRHSDRIAQMAMAYAQDSPLVALHGRQLNWAVTTGLVQIAQNPYRPPYVITDLMSDLRQAPYGAGPAGPTQWLQRYHVTARGSSTPEIYYRETNFLISAGGKFDGGVGAAILTEDEDAWPLPTTLMPSGEGVDIRALVRIQGSWEQDSRRNLCVTRGFACGLNPIVPAGIPKACREVHGDWTFLNLRGAAPTCPDYGFFVAVLRRPCPDDGKDKCDGDDTPDDDENNEDFDLAASPRFSYGLFEATNYPRSFASYVADVLAKNPEQNFKYGRDNVYSSPTGRVVRFFLGDDPFYPIISVDEPGYPTLQIERDYHKWPLAGASPTSDPLGGPVPNGGEVRSDEKIRACIIVDNTRMGQRLILDSSDEENPKRARVLLPTECRCPVVPGCQPQRLD